MLGMTSPSTKNEQRAVGLKTLRVVVRVKQIIPRICRMCRAWQLRLLSSDTFNMYLRIRLSGLTDAAITLEKPYPANSAPCLTSLRSEFVGSSRREPDPAPT